MHYSLLESYSPDGTTLFPDHEMGTHPSITIGAGILGFVTPYARITVLPNKSGPVKA